MDAVKYVKTKYRLCRSKDSCFECPLQDKENCGCIADTIEYVEKAVQIVEEWAKDNPIKTRQSKLLNMFPDVKIDDDGVVAFCPSNFLPSVERSAYCKKHKKCEECRKEYWLTEVTDNA